ncbi:MAG: type II secretion system major pseudopilin GspG [Longimicrobiaceae bacterium]
MTREHPHLADIVERILAAPPRPAQALARAWRADDVAGCARRANEFAAASAPGPRRGPDSGLAPSPRHPCGRGAGGAARGDASDLAPGRSRAGGFTLIEILVVIVVITVLATLVAPNVFRHVGSAKEATAKTQLEMLGSAIDAYRLDNDEYPTTEQGLAALRARPQSGPQPRSWRGPYLRRDVPLDPWGRPYVYRSPGVANPEGYDLLTLGRDGREGGEGEDADVLGWK